jgi:hypothetical protein
LLLLLLLLLRNAVRRTHLPPLAGLTDLDVLCAKYYKDGIRFAKWYVRASGVGLAAVITLMYSRRAVIEIARNKPSPLAIKETAEGLAAYAAICQVCLSSGGSKHCFALSVLAGAGQRTGAGRGARGSHGWHAHSRSLPVLDREVSNACTPAFYRSACSSWLF